MGRCGLVLNPNWEIDGLRIQLVTVRPARFFGIEEVWADQPLASTLGTFALSSSNQFIARLIRVTDRAAGARARA